MFKVTAVRFHTAIRTFSRLINRVFDNGLQHSAHQTRSNQTRVVPDLLFPNPARAGF